MRALLLESSDLGGREGTTGHGDRLKLLLLAGKIAPMAATVQSGVNEGLRDRVSVHRAHNCAAVLTLRRCRAAEGSSTLEPIVYADRGAHFSFVLLSSNRFVISALPRTARSCRPRCP